MAKRWSVFLIKIRGSDGTVVVMCPSQILYEASPHFLLRTLCLRSPFDVSVSKLRLGLDLSGSEKVLGRHLEFAYAP